ncbi:hypothetical protein [Streptomyces sp. URMC 129]|uniref:hypothetical protein n=1 Tax=Streptomyces sp. URMC 129 TaxID=3423407 RepID=UPI003F1CCFD0
MSSSERPDPTPWGALIAAARERRRLSVRKAAKLAEHVSEGRWRQIEAGHQVVTRGVYAPVRGGPETVARMAHTVGVTPRQLDEAGRADAAGELRRLMEENLGLDLAAYGTAAERVLEVLADVPPEHQAEVVKYVLKSLEP